LFHNLYSAVIIHMKQIMPLNVNYMPKCIHILDLLCMFFKFDCMNLVYSVKYMKLEGSDMYMIAIFKVGGSV
jgi:hypothetical protein